MKSDSIIDLMAHSIWSYYQIQYHKITILFYKTQNLSLGAALYLAHGNSDPTPPKRDLRMSDVRARKHGQIQVIAGPPPSPDYRDPKCACARTQEAGFHCHLPQRKILREPTKLHPVPMLIITSRLRGLFRFFHLYSDKT